VDAAFQGIDRDLDGEPSGAPLELLGELSVDEAIRVAEFRSALRRFMRHSERAARSAGLTPQRYLLLLMIKGAPEGREQSTVTELAERLQLAQSTVTELVDRAEEAGLVARARWAGDRRVAHLSLTPEGERRLAEGFEGLSHERGALRFAFAHLDAII
jgi:DNA-binding MarR family transcriptional regulator